MHHTFTLYAPTHDAVACHCSAWGNATRPMTRDATGMWSLAADLPVGTHRYTFQLRSRSSFLMDQLVDVSDPMTRWLASDRSTSTVIVPPSQSADDHTWAHDAHALPAHAELAIYELFIPLTGNDQVGTFATAIDRLDHIAELGFTAIELLPLTTSDATRGWGYTPAFFSAVEPRFGSEITLCRLIDAAHARGLAVILDLVVNHASKDCPWARIDHDAFFHALPKDPAAAWGPQFNYGHEIPATGERPARRLMKQVIAQWIQRFHLDGIRYDAVAQIRDRDVLPELTTWARHCAGEKLFFAIAECLPVEIALIAPEGPLDLCWRDSFGRDVRSLMTGIWDGKALESCIDCRKDGFPSGKNVVNYLASHDTGHTMRHLLDAGLDDATALARMRLGAVLLFTAVGIPMVWMGDEFGCADPADQNAEILAWHWCTQGDHRPALFALTRTLLQLRREHAALRDDHCVILLRDDLEGLLVFHRWDDGGGRILVVVHGAEGTATCRIHAPEGGRWREHTVGGEKEPNQAGELEFTVTGWEAQVWIHA